MEKGLLKLALIRQSKDESGVHMFNHFEEAETYFESRQNFGIKPGLERITHLLQLLGNPHKKMKAIHVAGTNGKGSTVNYLKNALIQNGYNVGVFQSPSLDDVTGHIFYNNERISKNDFVVLLNDMYPAICKLDELGNHPTEFEILTALTFLYFSNQVDIAIIEAGMGGRGDTTNCIQPILSIITNVDYDHTAFLGDTISEIAYQKAGIIKEQAPVIVGETKKEAISCIEKEASIKHAPLYRLYNEFTYHSVSNIDDKQVFTWYCSTEKQYQVMIRMYGNHQIKNCSLVMMALQVLHEKGFTIDMDKAIVGILSTVVPGRFEKIKDKPIIFIDGAHNPASIDFFIETVCGKFKDVNRHLIFAAFKDKDVTSMLDKLIPHFSTVTITSFNHPRATKVDTLSEFINQNNVFINNDWEIVLKNIIHSDETDKQYYFITGSLHFIALVRNFFVQEK